MVICIVMESLISNTSIEPASTHVSGLRTWWRLRPANRCWSLVSSLAIAFCLFLGTANAANWYVRPSAAGSANGTNWSNAWSLSGISWSNIGAGDTIWIAGGSYPGFTFGKSGSSGNPITLCRVTSSDPVPVAAPGWSSSFDAQVVFSSGIVTNSATYVTIDGHKWAPPGLPAVYGMLINNPGSPSDSTINVGVRMGDNTTVRNVEIAGPGYNVTQHETDGIILGSNCLVSGCKVHDMDTLLKSWIGLANTTVEYTTLYNVGSIIVSTPGVGPHPDSYYSSGTSSNFTVRYCVMANVVSEAFFFDMGGQTGTTFYGNVFVQGSTVPAGSSAIQVKEGYTYGTFFLYNNTFVDWSKGVLLDDYDNPPPTISASSVVQNNLFVNCNNGFDNNTAPYIVTKYNGYGSGSVKVYGGPQTSATVGSVNPFVSPTATGQDPTKNFAGYALAAGSWPVGKGSDLGPPYDIDMNGNSIGSNLGAFGTSGSGPQAPQAPQNLRLTSGQ
jgi:hypothetical protein